MKKILFFALLISTALFSIKNVNANEGYSHKEFAKADIYYNEACGGCGEYLKEKLIPYLQEQNVSVVLHDYVNDKQKRREMNAMQDELGIPFELQSHIMTFLDGGRAVLGGHVPLNLTHEIFAADNAPKRLVIFQDKMLEMGINESDVNYTVWQPGYEPKIYRLGEPLSQYLAELKEGQVKRTSWRSGSILPLILITGFLDGINPCAIAVLIFFIAFLFTLNGSWRKIIGYGLLYIAVIYLTYLGIGLGLFKAIIISDKPHLMAKIGAWLVVIMGLINILSYYLPRFWIKLEIPKFSQQTLKNWLTKGTLPAVIIGAFLVGLCTFPCSGGIYVAIISMLSASQTFWRGFGYLLIYNVMFVAPLLALLALVGNRYTLARVAEWQANSAGKLKLYSGAVMILLGVIILTWFV